MSFAIIRDSDNAWISGPVDLEPTPAAGQYVIEVALGYPTTCTWDAAGGGFVDKLPDPPTQCAALIALLVSKRVISSSDAAGLPL